jgi:hypothetical protein
MTTHENPAKTNDLADRRRGRGFPKVSLPDAIAIVTEAAKYGMSHQLSAFAGYMGHKTTNSGPFKQRLASLRDWNLITKDGDIIRLTELGRRLALPPDPNKTQSDLLSAFRNVQEFNEVYEGSAKGIPLDLDTLGNNAVHSLGVSVKSKEAFMESFARSAVAVGLARRPSDSQIILLADPTTGDGEPESTAADALPAHSTMADRPDSTALVVVFRQAWPVEGGEVRVEVLLDHPLPASVFSSLGSLVSEAEKVVEHLGAGDGSPE